MAEIAKVRGEGARGLRATPAGPRHARRRLLLRISAARAGWAALRPEIAWKSASSADAFMSPSPKSSRSSPHCCPRPPQGRRMVSPAPGDPLFAAGTVTAAGPCPSRLLLPLLLAAPAGGDRQHLLGAAGHRGASWLRFSSSLTVFVLAFGLAQLPCGPLADRFAGARCSSRGWAATPSRPWAVRWPRSVGWLVGWRAQADGSHLGVCAAVRDLYLAHEAAHHGARPHRAGRGSRAVRARAGACLFRAGMALGAGRDGVHEGALRPVLISRRRTPLAPGGRHVAATRGSARARCLRDAASVHGPCYKAATWRRDLLLPAAGRPWSTSTCWASRPRCTGDPGGRLAGLHLQHHDVPSPAAALLLRTVQLRVPEPFWAPASRRSGALWPQSAPLALLLGMRGTPGHGIHQPCGQAGAVGDSAAAGRPRRLVVGLRDDGRRLLAWASSQRASSTTP